MSDPHLEELVGLQPGLTVIEASAGTGKTYRITDLVARLVAEQGIPMREIVVVTFTTAATAELKDRIRGRLADALQAIESGVAKTPDLKAMADRCTVIPEAAQRLREAQRDFDQALISTIHGFCQRMLDSQSFECGADVGLKLLTDTGDLLEEIVDDWLAERLRVESLTQYKSLVQNAGFTREGLLRLAKAATQDPELPIEPKEGRWTPEAFASSAQALLDRWRGPEGTAVTVAFDQRHAAAESELTALLDKAGASPGKSLSKGKWLAEVFIEQLGWWPPLGEPLKSGLYSTKADHLSAWASGMAGTTPEGQRAAQAIIRLSFDHTTHLTKLTHWLDTAEGPHHPTEHTSINALLSAQPDPLPEGAKALLQDTAVFMDYRRCLATMDRVRFVTWARSELQARCKRRRLRTYHEQLSLLAAPLADPCSPQAQSLIGAIGSRVRATLIDEFQDTDALQWQIFRTLLGPWVQPGPDPRSHSEHRLFLIGDPKQAIYSFRGANLHVYLDAVSAAHRGLGEVHTLNTNYRTDAGLIEGLAHMMRDRPGFFGDARIGFLPVYADKGTRMHPPEAPLQVRFLARGPGTHHKPLSAEEATAQATDQVAHDIVDLLERGLELTEGEQSRPIDPGDIAVLVRSHAEGRLIQAALKRSRVPAVNFSTQDVFKSETCRHLLAWLRAIQEPGRAALVRTAATTPLFGMDGTLLAELDADQPEALRAWETWVGQLRDWRDSFTKRRFLATLRDAMTARRVAERLLSRTDGERRIADLQQLAELTHAAEIEGRLGLQALINWVEQQRRDKAESPDAVDIRLESESGAVKIQTMHTSKGLEYPIVFVPFAWRSAKLSKGDMDNLVTPNSEDPTTRLMDLQLSHTHPEKAARLTQAERDQLEEAIRLTYVALTRAKHRCILTAGHIQPIALGPLAPMLWGDGAEAGEDRLVHAARKVGQWTRKTAGEAELTTMWGALYAWANACPGIEGTPTVSAHHCSPLPTRARWSGPAPEQHVLQTRTFHRTGLDRVWRRHSYSSFVKAAGHAPTTLEQDAGLDLDQDVTDDIHPDTITDGPPVPLSPFPAGATPGIVLHEVLEKMDFAWAQHSADPSPFDALLTEILSNHGMVDQRQTLHTGLKLALNTPLGGPLGDLRLSQLSTTDRLDELRFDLPLAGGDKHRAKAAAPVNGAALIRALQTAPSQGVPGDYLKSLEHRDWSNMSGFLNGAIDLVMRAPNQSGHIQWFVVDYKSNRLAPSSQPEVPAQTYRPARLLEEMGHHDYHLQYHLYTLALHRFLKTRLPDYDYERDIGGAYYLFVRGMVGDPEDTTQTGVFYARPSQPVIEAMDALVGGDHA